MKDEYSGKSILKFVGLKSQTYSILNESYKEKSTSKGYNVFIDFQEFTIYYLRKRFLDIQREEKNLKIIILVPMKLIDDLYYVLIISDIFPKRELIHQQWT